MIRSLIRRLLIVPAILAVFGTAVAAQTLATLDPPKPRLRAQATISSDVVRIGDLVDHAGIVANIAIFRAPDLGSTGTVSAQRVADAVREHAIVGLDTAGLDEVVVTRASRTISVEDIETRIARALTAQFSLGAAENLSLNFDRGIKPIYVPQSAKGEPHVAHLDFDPRSGRFDATIDISGARSADYALRFTGKATPTVNVTMLVRALNRGEIIKAADVITERRPRAEAGNDAIAKADQVIGFAARSAVQPGRPLRSYDLVKPDLVQRDQAVTLVYRVPGIMLTVRGKAIESGAEGDTISVLNEQSKRTVQGTVSGPGHVVVMGNMARVAENTAAEVETLRNAPNRAQ
ncbi:MAG: flagellar basal body P-ring formation chaperone FlgA [Pseudolabrys sp.]